MPPDKDEIRRRYQYRCGYCGVREGDVGAELTVDHFRPRSRGGSDDPDNLVYCCHACNEFKGDFWEPDAASRLLHPLHDDPGAHLSEAPDGILGGLTDTGAFHIDRLHLNRPPLVEYRLERRRLEAARRVEQQLLDHLRELDGRLDRLLADLTQLRRGAVPDGT